MPAIRATGIYIYLIHLCMLLKGLSDTFFLFWPHEVKLEGVKKRCLKIAKYTNTLTLFQQKIFSPLFKSPRGSQATYGMHESCSLQICQSILATPCINPNSAINMGLPAQGLPTGPQSAIHPETNHLLLHWSMGPKSKKLQGTKSHTLSLCSHGAKTISVALPMLTWSPADGGGLESRWHHRLEGAAASDSEQ